MSPLHSGLCYTAHMDKQSLGKLKLWPDNYNEGDVGMIAASIRRFGFNDPPGVWQDNEVRDGNHRVMALRVVKAAGPRPDEDKKWPPQGVTVKGADWLIDWIDLSHLNAQEATAYAIAANRSVELASQDDLRLSMLLQNIAVEDEKLLAATGYGGDDLDELLRFMDKPPEDVGAQVDRAAELQEVWQVQRGDLWRIGEHRLLCGDSTVREDVEHVMDGQRASLCVTDPPYGVDYDAAWRESIRPSNVSRVGKIQNDDISDWSLVWSSLESDIVYIWHASLKTSDTALGLEAAGFKLRTFIVWAKPFPQIGRGNYHWQHESCWYAVKKGSNAAWIGDRKQTSVWDDITPIGDAYGCNDEEQTPHATQKPLECMARPIRNHDAPIVYDPFGGSGTTMVAAEQLGRRCRMIEIEPKYCAVILERMSDLGLKPERVAK